jgi:hypothetical protein
MYIGSDAVVLLKSLLIALQASVLNGAPAAMAV